MAGHLFVYTPNKDITMQEYLCDYEECLCSNFFFCVKNTSKSIKNNNNDIDSFEDCLLDKKMIPLKYLNL